MQIEDKRKCKNRKTVCEMDYGTVFAKGQDYFLVTDEGSGDGGYYNEENGETILCVNLSNGELLQMNANDTYEVIKAKIVIE